MKTVIKIPAVLTLESGEMDETEIELAEEQGQLLVEVGGHQIEFPTQVLRDALNGLSPQQQQSVSPFVIRGINERATAALALATRLEQELQAKQAEPADVDRLAVERNAENISACFAEMAAINSRLDTQAMLVEGNIQKLAQIISRIASLEDAAEAGMDEEPADLLILDKRTPTEQAIAYDLAPQNLYGGEQ